MSTFLELAQRVAQESGTIDGAGLPAAVTGQRGRLAKIVTWTASACRSIGNERADWLFHRGEFEGSTTAGTRRYTGASFGIDRFGRWLTPRSLEEPTYTSYDPAIGLSDEGSIHYLPWLDFYASQLRGPEQTGRPVCFSIDPAGALVLSPMPDRAYTIRGLFRKTPKELVAAEDQPDWPAHLHEIVVWRALMSLAMHDEAVLQLSAWRSEYERCKGHMYRECLPVLSITARPIA